MKKLTLYPSSIFLIAIIFLTGCNKESNDPAFKGENKSFYQGETGNSNNNSGNQGGNNCPSVYTDPRDGQTYNIVQIGNQCWFAENLNYQTGNSWCYDNSSAKCDTYGRLYDWETALTACPSGWHMASDGDWFELSDYLGGSSIAGGKLKETGTTHWMSPNTNATNETGFTALPGGYGSSSQAFFESISSRGYWWTSTEYSSATSLAWYRKLNYDDGVLSTHYTGKLAGFCVRCVRD